MAAVNSTMLALGTRAPQFMLPDTEGNRVTLDQFDGAPAYVVMFICNHCPYVLHLRKVIAEVADHYSGQDVAFIAINSNDTEAYPADSYEKMREQVKQTGYRFPYLYDESQAVAKAYRAACTPDFYVFDKNLLLTYRGRFDESRPGNDQPVTGLDLRTAIDATLDGDSIPDDVQKPSLGCNIKWKPGNEPDYFTRR